MRRINLLHAHGSPTSYQYRQGCRCAPCRRAEAANRFIYNEQHRDETREAARRQRARNPDGVRDYGLRYNAEHAKDISDYYRKWAAANPDKVRDHWTAQRARRAQAEGDHTTADLRAQYTRQKGRCFYCKRRLGDSYHAEHVMPVILGGSNGSANIVAACPNCNHRKAAKHPMDFAGILF